MEALDQISYCTELTHNANDFVKLGGLTLLIRLLDSSNSEIRAIVASIIGSSAGNNPEYQESVLLERGTLEKLINMMSNDSDGVVRSKALLAISAMVRQSGNSTEAYDIFISEDGVEKLVALLSSPDESDNMKRRIVFFMTYLTKQKDKKNQSRLFELLQKEDGFNVLLSLMKERDYDIREKCLGFLISFVQSCSKSRKKEIMSYLRKLGMREAVGTIKQDEVLWSEEDVDHDSTDLIEQTKTLIALL